MKPRQPRSTLFPYTTLFRSLAQVDEGGGEVDPRLDALGPRGKTAFEAGRYADAAAELRRALAARRSEEHTSELQSLRHLVCRLLLEKKKPLEEAPRSLRGDF